MMQLVKSLSILVLFVPSASALMCYECVSGTNLGDCVTDFDGLIDSAMGVNKQYVKNCTASKSTLDRCMILTGQMADGGYSYFYRGCHDGKTFGAHHDSPLFQNLNPTNASVCDLLSSVTCYRPCNTDFCNGPLVPKLTEQSRNKTIQALCERYNPYKDKLPLGVTCAADVTKISSMSAIVVFGLFVYLVNLLG